jgi:zinc protease
MKKDYKKTTLSNGLTVFLKEIHTAPLVSSWVWYRVGSKDETTGRTGVSHWTEHMQFKGTPKFPAKVLDKAVSRDGGVWNAFTFMDWTTYFETMPTDKIDLGLRLEADRMSNSIFDSREVASERTVIISEREGSENEPMFRLGEAITHAAFRVHPYHHEILGDKADLLTITRDDLFRHYKTYYVPNNAIMAVAGDFDSDSMLARIRELFEPIPAGATPPRLARHEPPQMGELTLNVEGPGETTYLQVAYRFPAASHPDFFSLSVLDSLLAGPSNLNMFGGGISNRTSRLYRALVEKNTRSAYQAERAPQLIRTFTRLRPLFTRSANRRRRWPRWMRRSRACSPNASPRPRLHVPSNRRVPFSRMGAKASPIRPSGWAIRKCSQITTGS